MSKRSFLTLGSLKDADAFCRYLEEQRIAIPCDRVLDAANTSPLAKPITSGRLSIGNRYAIQPMEGWDGMADGKPSDFTFRRWRNFGRSGAKLIWGGEAAAVRHDGRANPNQLLITEDTASEVARLRETLIAEHKRKAGSTQGLVVGLQFTHSGRYSRPNFKDRPEPRILYHHPILDGRLGLPADYPVMTDADIRRLIEDFHRAGRLAYRIGFDFVDIKHCHGYLGHEFLSAHTREGNYGGPFENRTRFLREVVEGIRSAAPGLEIGVRLSAFDTIPFQSSGHPVSQDGLLPYRWGFGVNPTHPVDPDLTEAVMFLSLLRNLNIGMVNISAGSPYYNPHIQRPAQFPPSDGYAPPEDPLIGVARQMNVTRTLKLQFPDMLIVGTAYSYLQDFLPYVAQAAVRGNWVDCVGLGRMVLAYPELPWDVLNGGAVERRRFCRTFSDCTTAPRNGLPSGCYPLDGYYKDSELGQRLKQVKSRQQTHTSR
jgi:2,4-dienoyl-CoA reductase-like NADH-dependent reductase (Old Yellow Enzyme family)